MLTDTQLAQRRQGIGASEVAAVLGLAPYATPLDVWMRKTGRQGSVPPQTQASRMGHLLEPIVAQLYAEETGASLRESGTLVGEEPWMLATPDRIATKHDMEWLVEIKTKSFYTAKAFGEPGTDAVPPEILCQVLWQQRVTGLYANADVAVLVDGRDYVVYRVPYDRDLADDIVTQCRDWWQRHVVEDTEPAITGGSGIAYLQRKFAQHTDVIVQADDTAEDYLAQLADAKRRLKEAELAEESARLALMQMIGDAAGMHGVHGKVSWRQVKGRAFTDWKSLAIAKGASTDEIEQYTNSGAPSRQFRFTAAKEA
jgi:putative phage-type endonuclease